MTLIARCEFNGVPLYIGDLLVSRPRARGEDVDIPAANRVNVLLAGRGREVADMVQKIQLVSERLIVAWAGDRIQARTLMREPKELDEKEGVALTTEKVFSLIEAIPADERDDLSMIGSICIQDASGGVKLDHWAYKADHTGRNGEVLALAGTGAKEFLDLLPHLVDTSPMPSDIDHGLFDWVEKIGYALLGCLVGTEILIGNNLTQWWGGAFELATLRDGGFRKIGGNTLFSFWRLVPGQAGDQQDLRLIPKLLKYDYVRDGLLIQKLDFVGAMTGGDVQSHSKFWYPSLLKPSPQPDPIPTFTHTTLCCFILGALSPVLETGIVVHYDSDGDSLMPVWIDGTKCHIPVHRTLIHELEDNATMATGIWTKFSQIGL